MAAPRRALDVRGDRPGRRAAGLDGRPRRAADRRRAARPPRAVAARGDAVRGPRRARPVADHERLHARAPGRPAGAGGAAARQPVAGLARAGPLLPTHAARRAGAGAGGAPGRRAPPGAASDQGQRRRAQGLHRGRGRALRRVRAPPSLRGAVHRVHAAGRRPRLVARPRAPERRGPAAYRRRVPARAARPRAQRYVPPLALRRRQGRDRLHLSRDRAVLRRLQPHPLDRRGRAADVPVLDARDRSARAAARRRLRRRARGHHPRGRLAQGAQAPRERPRVRPAGAHDVADRRMKDLAEALELVLADIAPLPAEASPLAEAAGRVAAAPARAAVDLPPFDRTAMDGFAVRAQDARDGAELRVIGDLAAGGETLALEPGTAARISTGAAIPPGADAVLRSEDAELRDGTVVARAEVTPRLHVR